VVLIILVVDEQQRARLLQIHPMGQTNDTGQEAWVDYFFVVLISRPTLRFTQSPCK
jgi:hypothetical protein